MFEEQWMEKVEICQEILRNSKNELYLNLRFLDVALNRLRLSPSVKERRTATDGTEYAYHPDIILEQYRAEPVRINRGYLHTVLHCLFGHLWNDSGRECPGLWNLACDLAVEHILDGLYCRCLRLPPNPFRRAAYQGIQERIPVIHAEAVYRLLGNAKLDARLQARLIREFAVDSHGLWPGQNPKEPPRARIEQPREWKDLRDKMETELQTFSKEASEESGALLEQLRVENRERYDYREFLRKFSVLKEEMQVDLDSFDYIFYHYGMELYGNMPLIEPQETREVTRIEDFVIVIDTSMSCKERLVRKFLEETYDVLSQAESFSRRFRIHIIQCDENVQSDRVVENSRQLQDYMEHFEVKGMGGTDFRPAFAYVEELLARKEFRKLRGLLYFTDGYGTFPLKKPAYDTAFVFFREDYLDVDVPPWAIKLILDAQDMEKKPEF